MLVKKVFGSKSQVFTTGKGYFAEQPKVTFVMVKDTQDRFPKNKAWGEGWGWALFTNESPMKSTTTNWKGEDLIIATAVIYPLKSMTGCMLRGTRKNY